MSKRGWNKPGPFRPSNLALVLSNIPGKIRLATKVNMVPDAIIR